MMKRETFDTIQAIRFFLVMVLVVNAVMSNYVWAVVPSASMEPTLKIGTYCFARRAKDVGYGDIVCFLPYDDPPAHDGALYMLDLKINNKKMFVKRVVGLPGDTIEVKDGCLYRNDEPLAEDYLKEPYIRHNFGPVTVEDGCVFFMGDNRNNSNDSRAFGQIPCERIVGRVFRYITPLNFSD